VPSADILKLPAGDLRLSRPGSEPGLRAWDAADELLLAEAVNRLAESPRILVIDDQFGALSLGLAQAHGPVTSVADSAVLPKALEHNARLNPGITRPALLHSWLNPPEGLFDLVVLRIPRHGAYLGWLLRWVNTVLADNGCLLASGMIKHLPDRSVDVFAETVITETVLPARKKARVVVCRKGQAQLQGWAESWKGYRQVGLPAPVEALPAVFARDKLDIGTRELLPLLGPAVSNLPPGAKILDLACGNGVLGLSVLACRNDVTVDFSDVSSQAIASVQHNLGACGYQAGQCQHSDGIREGTGQYDLVLLNPPFHEGGVVGDHIALRLFRDAAKHLAPGGRMLMVGNRHLGYHKSLKRFFGKVEQRAASPRFVVFEAAP
jgi:16S rRNA (guanine1207-N2)-methyltransferase